MIVKFFTLLLILLLLLLWLPLPMMLLMETRCAWSVEHVFSRILLHVFADCILFRAHTLCICCSRSTFKRMPKLSVTNQYCWMGEKFPFGVYFRSIWFWLNCLRWRLVASSAHEICIINFDTAQKYEIHSEKRRKKNKIMNEWMKCMVVAAHFMTLKMLSYK